MARRRKGKTVKNNKSTLSNETNETEAKAPHSFVIHRGVVGKCVQELTNDFRKVMEPYTASNIKVRPKNVVKDFVHVAGLLNVSHMCSFTKTDLGIYLKLARFPRGPTLTFRIQDYVLARDVRSSLKKQITYEKQFENHALLVMNSFSGDGKEIQLMTSMFQNMFPSLNVTKVKLNTVRRCVLLNYNASSGTIDFRHYTIKVVPVGMTKGVKKIVQGKVPNLSRYEDMAEFLAKSGNLSESEFEDDDTTKVTLSQNVSSRGNNLSGQSSVRLVELGPRMTLQLIKIEEGLHDGEVLYHKFVEKTDEEKRKIKQVIAKRKKEKEYRKKEQDANVKKKKEIKDKMKEKSLQGMNKRKAEDDDAVSSEDDDDAQWFEKEMGEKPDKDLFDTSYSRKGHQRAPSNPRFPGKKRKTDQQNWKPGGGGSSRNDKSMQGKSGWKTGGAGGNKNDKRKTNQGGRKFSSNSNDDRPMRRPKRKTDVYNSQGVGPNFKRGSSKGPAPRVVAKKRRGRH